MTAQFDAANLTVESALAYMDNAVSNNGYTLDEAYNAIRDAIAALRKARKIDTVEAGDLRIRLNEAHTRAKKIIAEHADMKIDADAPPAVENLTPAELEKYCPETTPDGTTSSELVDAITARINRKTRTAALHQELEQLVANHTCTPVHATAIIARAVVAANAAGKVSPSAQHRVHSGLERAAAAHGVQFRW